MTGNDGLEERISKLEERTGRIEERHERDGQLLYDIDKILVRGNGKPSMQEDVRTVLAFVKTMQFWITTIALAFIAQFITIGVGIVITLIQLLPILERLTQVK